MNHNSSVATGGSWGPRPLEQALTGLQCPHKISPFGTAANRSEANRRVIEWLTKEYMSVPDERKLYERLSNVLPRSYRSLLLDIFSHGRQLQQEQIRQLLQDLLDYRCLPEDLDKKPEASVSNNTLQLAIIQHMAELLGVRRTMVSRRTPSQPPFMVNRKVLSMFEQFVIDPKSLRNDSIQTLSHLPDLPKDEHERHEMMEDLRDALESHQAESEQEDAPGDKTMTVVQEHVDGDEQLAHMASLIKDGTSSLSTFFLQNSTIKMPPSKPTVNGDSPHLSGLPELVTMLKFYNTYQEQGQVSIQDYEAVMGTLSDAAAAASATSNGLSDELLKLATDTQRTIAHLNSQKKH